MNRIVKRLLKYLKLEYICFWVIAILTFVLGQVGVIPNGIFAGEAAVQYEFYLNSTCIILVLVGVPLSLKLFNLNTNNGLRRMNKDEALGAYHLWSCIRLGILLVCAEMGIVCYFLLMNNTGLFCACIALIMALICAPSESKVCEYLETKEEERAESVN